MSANAQNMIGQSPALMAALDHLSSLAAIDRPVLVLGERGTGKELAGERLHFLSPRWSDIFVKINCGAITETLLESELFGHEAGAFTGATKQHIGRFERADGGTLFLDELGTMSLRLQEKLLRLDPEWGIPSVARHALHRVLEEQLATEHRQHQAHLHADDGQGRDCRGGARERCAASDGSFQNIRSADCRDRPHRPLRKIRKRHPYRLLAL